MKQEKIYYKYLKKLFNCFIERLAQVKKLYCTKNQSGQSSTEFALVVPFLIFMILVVFQLGYLVYLQNLVEHAAHESTRIVATCNSNSDAKKIVHEVLKKQDDKNLEINISPDQGSQRKTGDIVRVEVKYYYDGAAEIIKFLTGRSLLVQSQCSMRMECGNE